MTEIGMAISNPYEGPRVPGHIGFPLPGMKVRLVDENNLEVTQGDSGQIQVMSERGGTSMTYESRRTRSLPDGKPVERFAGVP